jgi:hypothetical protein
LEGVSVNSSQRKSQVIIILPLVIFLVIPCLILVEPRIDRPVIEIIEGEEVDVPEELLLSYESYTPEDTVILLNQSTLDRSRWRFYYESASYVVTVPIVNISAITIGLTVRALNEPLEISMNEHFTDMENSTSLSPHESDELKLRIPYLLMRSATRNNWFKQLVIGLEFENHNFDDFEVTNFWIQATTLEDLYPITIDIQRTNGDSLYSNPTSVGLWEDPELHFNYTTLGSSTFFSPAQVNETLLLLPGYYELSLSWRTYDLTGEVRVTNNSALVKWRIKCIRIDIQMTQDISGISVTIDGNYDHYYRYYLVVYSPSFYMPPDQYVIIDILSFSSAYSGNMGAGTTLTLGWNVNITLSVDPGLISVGGTSITLGRLLIFVISILFILSLTILIFLKKETTIRLLPLLILFIGVVLPGMQVSSSSTFPYPTSHDVTNEVWMLSPAIFTSYFAQDNFSLAIGPSDVPHTLFLGIEIGSLVLGLFLLLLIGSIHEILATPGELKIRDDQFSFLFGLIILFEFMAIIGGLLTGLDSFLLGPGPIVSILALGIWGMLHMRAERTPPQPKIVNREQLKKREKMERV